MTEEDLFEEVIELTNMLRHSSNLEKLRIAISERGVDVQRALMFSFFEDEELNEFGVILSGKCDIFRYIRNNDDGYTSDLIFWEKIDDFERAKLEYPQLEFALKLAEQSRNVP